jgi:hypothetical protein
MREAQKIKRLRLTFSSTFPVLFGGSAKLNPARFVGVELQSELPQPFPQVLQEAVCVRLVLEARDGIVSITDDHHLALRPLLAPGVHPEVESVVQVNIREER